MNKFNVSKYIGCFNCIYFFHDGEKKWCNHCICSQINSFAPKFPSMKKLFDYLFWHCIFARAQLKRDCFLCLLIFVSSKKCAFNILFLKSGKNVYFAYVIFRQLRKIFVNNFAKTAKPRETCNDFWDMERNLPVIWMRQYSTRVSKVTFEYQTLRYLLA